MRYPASLDAFGPQLTSTLPQRQLITMKDNNQESSVPISKKFIAAHVTLASILSPIFALPFVYPIILLGAFQHPPGNALNLLANEQFVYNFTWSLRSSIAWILISIFTYGALSLPFTIVFNSLLWKWKISRHNFTWMMFFIVSILMSGAIYALIFWLGSKSLRWT